MVYSSWPLYRAFDQAVSVPAANHAKKRAAVAVLLNMPLNVPGLLAPFQLVWNPRVVVPKVVVRDIRQLDFVALRNAGYRGAVFDKDNCLTLPNRDTLVPEIEDAWKDCRRVFGEENILIVSNSAGTRQDPGQVQAESVSHHLSVPVLRHDAPKPAYACIGAIRRYFSTLRTPIADSELVVVGDRIFTDVVMANRMRGPLSVWTTGVWEREGMVVRWMEAGVVRLLS